MYIHKYSKDFWTQPSAASVVHCVSCALVGFVTTHFQPARSAGETGSPAPGTKPENGPQGCGLN